MGSVTYCIRVNFCRQYVVNFLAKNKEKKKKTYFICIELKKLTKKKKKKKKKKVCVGFLPWHLTVKRFFFFFFFLFFLPFFFFLSLTNLLRLTCLCHFSVNIKPLLGLWVAITYVKFFPDFYCNHSTE